MGDKKPRKKAFPKCCDGYGPEIRVERSQVVHYEVVAYYGPDHEVTTTVDPDVYDETDDEVTMVCGGCHELYETKDGGYIEIDGFALAETA